MKILTRWSPFLALLFTFVFSASSFMTWTVKASVPEEGYQVNILSETLPPYYLTSVEKINSFQSYVDNQSVYQTPWRSRHQEFSKDNYKLDLELLLGVDRVNAPFQFCLEVSSGSCSTLWVWNSSTQTYGKTYRVDHQSASTSLELVLDSSVSIPLLSTVPVGGQSANLYVYLEGQEASKQLLNELMVIQLPEGLSEIPTSDSTGGNVAAEDSIPVPRIPVTFPYGVTGRGELRSTEEGTLSYYVSQGRLIEPDLSSYKDFVPVNWINSIPIFALGPVPKKTIEFWKQREASFIRVAEKLSYFWTKSKNNGYVDISDIEHPIIKIKSDTGEVLHEYYIPEGQISFIESLYKIYEDRYTALGEEYLQLKGYQGEVALNLIESLELFDDPTSDTNIFSQFLNDTEGETATTEEDWTAWLTPLEEKEKLPLILEKAQLKIWWDEGEKLFTGDLLEEFELYQSNYQKYQRLAYWKAAFYGYIDWTFTLDYFDPWYDIPRFKILGRTDNLYINVPLEDTTLGITDIDQILELYGKYQKKASLIGRKIGIHKNWNHMRDENDLFTIPDFENYHDKGYINGAYYSNYDVPLSVFYKSENADEKGKRRYLWSTKVRFGSIDRIYEDYLDKEVQHLRIGTIATLDLSRYMNFSNAVGAFGYTVDFFTGGKPTLRFHFCHKAYCYKYRDIGVGNPEDLYEKYEKYFFEGKRRQMEDLFSIHDEYVNNYYLQNYRSSSEWKYTFYDGNTNILYGLREFSLVDRSIRQDFFEIGKVDVLLEQGKILEDIGKYYLGYAALKWPNETCQSTRVDWYRLNPEDNLERQPIVLYPCDIGYIFHAFDYEKLDATLRGVREIYTKYGDQLLNIANLMMSGNSLVTNWKSAVYIDAHSWNFRNRDYGGEVLSLFIQSDQFISSENGEGILEFRLNASGLQKLSQIEGMYARYRDGYVEQGEKFSTWAAGLEDSKLTGDLAVILGFKRPGAIALPDFFTPENPQFMFVGGGETSYFTWNYEGVENLADWFQNAEKYSELNDDGLTNRLASVTSSVFSGDAGATSQLVDLNGGMRITSNGESYVLLPEDLEGIASLNSQFSKMGDALGGLDSSIKEELDKVVAHLNKINEAENQLSSFNSKMASLNNGWNQTFFEEERGARGPMIAGKRIFSGDMKADAYARAGLKGAATKAEIALNAEVLGVGIPVFNAKASYEYEFEFLDEINDQILKPIGEFSTAAEGTLGTMTENTNLVISKISEPLNMLSSASQALAFLKMFDQILRSGVDLNHPLVLKIVDEQLKKLLGSLPDSVATYGKGKTLSLQLTANELIAAAEAYRDQAGNQIVNLTVVNNAVERIESRITELYRLNCGNSSCYELSVIDLALLLESIIKQDMEGARRAAKRIDVAVKLKFSERFPLLETPKFQVDVEKVISNLKAAVLFDEANATIRDAKIEIEKAIAGDLYGMGLQLDDGEIVEVLEAVAQGNGDEIVKEKVKVVIDDFKTQLEEKLSLPGTLGKLQDLQREFMKYRTPNVGVIRNELIRELGVTEAQLQIALSESDLNALAKALHSDTLDWALAQKVFGKLIIGTSIEFAVERIIAALPENPDLAQLKAEIYNQFSLDPALGQGVGVSLTQALLYVQKNQEALKGLQELVGTERTLYLADLNRLVAELATLSGEVTVEDLEREVLDVLEENIAGEEESLKNELLAVISTIKSQKDEALIELHGFTYSLFNQVSGGIDLATSAAMNAIIGMPNLNEESIRTWIYGELQTTKIAVDGDSISASLGQVITQVQEMEKVLTSLEKAITSLYASAGVVPNTPVNVSMDDLKAIVPSLFDLSMGPSIQDSLRLSIAVKNYFPELTTYGTPLTYLGTYKKIEQLENTKKVVSSELNQFANAVFSRMIGVNDLATAQVALMNSMDGMIKQFALHHLLEELAEETGTITSTQIQEKLFSRFGLDHLQVQYGIIEAVDLVGNAEITALFTSLSSEILDESNKLKTSFNQVVAQEKIEAILSKVQEKLLAVEDFNAFHIPRLSVAPPLPVSLFMLNLKVNMLLAKVELVTTVGELKYDIEQQIGFPRLFSTLVNFGLETSFLDELDAELETLQGSLNNKQLNQAKADLIRVMALLQTGVLEKLKTFDLETFVTESLKANLQAELDNIRNAIIDNLQTDVNKLLIELSHTALQNFGFIDPSQLNGDEVKAFLISLEGILADLNQTTPVISENVKTLLNAIRTLTKAGPSSLEQPILDLAKTPLGRVLVAVLFKITDEVVEGFKNKVQEGMANAMEGLLTSLSSSIFTADELAQMQGRLKNDNIKKDLVSLNQSVSSANETYQNLDVSNALDTHGLIELSHLRVEDYVAVIEEDFVRHEGAGVMTDGNSNLGSDSNCNQSGVCYYIQGPSYSYSFVVFIVPVTVAFGVDGSVSGTWNVNLTSELSGTFSGKGHLGAYVSGGVVFDAEQFLKDVLHISGGFVSKVIRLVGLNKVKAGAILRADLYLIQDTLTASARVSPVFDHGIQLQPKLGVKNTLSFMGGEIYSDIFYTQPVGIKCCFSVKWKRRGFRNRIASHPPWTPPPFELEHTPDPINIIQFEGW